MYKNVRKILFKEKEIFILNKDGLVVRLPLAQKKYLDRYATEEFMSTSAPKNIKDLADLGILEFKNYRPKQTKINYDDILIKANGRSPVYEAPIIAHLSITNKCNMECAYCSVRQIHKKFPVELSTSQLKIIIKKLGDWGVFQIGLTGGEPTLREDIVELADYISSAGVACNMTTNGWLINKKMANQLFRAGMEQVQVSLDSYKKEMHELHRNKGSYDRALRAIEILQDAGMKVGVDCVVSKNNLNDIMQFIHFLAGKKVFGLTLIKLKQGDLPKELFFKLVPDYLKYGKLLSEICYRENVAPEVTIDCASMPNLNYSLTQQEQNYLHCAGCPAGHTLIAVAPNGDIYPCAALSASQYKVGNVLSDNLVEIWQKNDLFQNLRDIKNSVQGFCKTCSRLDNCRGGCRGIADTFGGLYQSDLSCEREEVNIYE